MAIAEDVFAAVYKNSTAVLFARVVDADGTPVQPTDIASIQYTINERIDNRAEVGDPVPGHEASGLTVSEVFFDTLQTDANWSVDAEGYNFRHEIDVTSNEAFPKAGVSYQVRYQLQPAVGQKIVFRFQLRAI
ncbi:MAG: hypothetical protein AAGF31_01380 [Planctomycetota bacterium]